MLLPVRRSTYFLYAALEILAERAPHLFQTSRRLRTAARRCGMRAWSGRARNTSRRSSGSLRVRASSKTAGVSAPMSSACVPSQIRWLAMRCNSVMIVADDFRAPVALPRSGSFFHRFAVAQPVAHRRHVIHAVHVRRKLLVRAVFRDLLHTAVQIPMTHSVPRTRSPSSFNFTRSTPCVEGCCGPC